MVNCLEINQRFWSYYNLPYSVFWGWLYLEIQPQNPEFRNHPENIHPCDYTCMEAIKYRKPEKALHLGKGNQLTLHITMILHSHT